MLQEADRTGTEANLVWEYKINTMKIKFLIFVILLSAISAHSQSEIFHQKGVEKSLFNVQAGFLGVWLNHEMGLSNDIALRTEAGLYGGLSFGYNGDAEFGFVPGILIEPRWYYSIQERGDKKKDIANNGSNFITVAIAYYPDWFVLSGNKKLYINHQFHIIPKWAVRRNIGDSNFNYELGVGLGYVHHFSESNNDNNSIIDFHARIGYRF